MQHGNVLEIDRCPHCGVALPSLVRQFELVTTGHAGDNKRYWATYACQSCGGVSLAVSPVSSEHPIAMVYPEVSAVSEAVPIRARDYLTQAMASRSATAGAVMLAASAVDAMLKDKGLKTGSLYSRIDAAAKEHLITPEMATWAHEVRLEANDQRHVDETGPLPNDADAERVIAFAAAVAQFIYVLPAQVQRGRKNREAESD